MTLLIIILKMVICSGVLYTYYWLFLRNRKFHFYNRFFLLSASLLSIIIPFIKIPVFFHPQDNTGKIFYESLEVIRVDRWEEEFTTDSSTLLNTWFTLPNTLVAIYIIGALILFTLFISSLLYIRQLRKKFPYQVIHDLNFYDTIEPGTPLSFFRSIFWNRNIDVTTREGQQIFRHELFHVTQKHSFDTLFLELVHILCWFNPFFYLIKKELKAIHEFLADENAAREYNQHDYAELLILQCINAKNNHISHSFFQNHIKRRIAMITNITKRKYSYWTRILVLPISAILFCAIAVYAQDKNETFNNPPTVLAEQITVLVDAGHGGKDPGAKSYNGLNEKDMALILAKQIQQQASAFNIKVIMTRERDIFPELKERVAIADKINADLVISLHMSAHPESTAANGFVLYVTNKIKTEAPSRMLAEQIANQISPFYKIGSIKQRNSQGIWILDRVSCPAVLIECGYITNENDVEFVTKTENQERIAKSILQGIVNFKTKPLHATDTDSETREASTSVILNSQKDAVGKQLLRHVNQNL